MKRIIPMILICVLMITAVLPVSVAAWDIKCDTCVNSDGKCKECGGDGEVNCSSDCNGTGEIDCITCVNGKKECKECTEDTRPDCNFCFGIGTVDCDECDAKGSTLCGLCEGDGKVDCFKCVISTSPDMKGKCVVCGGDGRITKGEGAPTDKDFETYGDKILDYKAPNTNQNDNQGTGNNQEATKPPAQNTENQQGNNTATKKDNDLYKQLINATEDSWAVDFIKTSNENTERVELFVVISTENNELVKNLSNNEIKTKKNELETLIKTISFNASSEMSVKFKSATGENQLLAVNFDGHCDVGFKVAVSVLVKDVDLFNKTVFGYHYNETTETFEKLESVVCNTKDDGTEVIFVTDKFSDFMFSMIDTTTIGVAPSEPQVTDGDVDDWSLGLSQTMQYVVLFLTLVISAVAITLISIKAMK